jgi:hypothetical protein
MIPACHLKDVLRNTKAWLKLSQSQPITDNFFTLFQSLRGKSASSAFFFKEERKKLKKWQKWW